MKHTLPFLILLISCSGNSDLTDERANLSKYMDEYIRSINEKDHRAQLDFLPGGCLQGKSKDELAAQMDAIEMPDFVPEFYVEKEFSIDTLLMQNDQFYARISNYMVMLNDYSQFKDENGSSLPVSLALEDLKSKFGKENVTFNEETWIASCRSKTTVYGYSADGEEWLIFGITPCTSEYIPEGIRVE